MRKRLCLALASLLVAVLAGLAWRGLRPNPPEPVFQGKPASYWIAHLSAPLGFPSPGVPAATLKLPPASELGTDLRSLHLDAHLSYSVRRESEPIKEIHPLSLVPEPDPPSWVALRAMGPQAMPLLLNALKNPDHQVAVNASRLLGEIAPVDDTVVTALLQGLLIRESAAHRTYRIAWGKLPNLLKQRLPWPEAPQSFPKRGGDYWYKKALPSLGTLYQLLGRASLHNENGSAAMTPFLKAVPAFCTALKAPEDWLSNTAAMRLGEIGPAAKAAVPSLIQEVQNTNRHPQVQAAIADALARMGPAAKTGVPTLIRELQNANRHPEVRVSMAFALGQTGPDSPEATRALLSAVEDRSRVVQCAAIATLGKCRSAKDEAISSLRQIWKGDDPLLRYLAYQSLSDLDPQGMKNTRRPDAIRTPESFGFGRNFDLPPGAVDEDYKLFERFKRGGSW